MPYSAHQKLTRLLGIQVPIFQAPTASIAGPELALAVSEAGGLGGMGLTWTDPNTAVQNVHYVQERTNRPFLVNFALSFEPVALAAVLDAGAPIVTFSWGDPSPYVSLVKSHGAKLGVQVGNTAGALAAVECGADFVICQGIEAGGHVQSTTALDVLLLSVIHAIPETTVVAAGGLATGEDIARVFSLGASGAMLGTRFVATKESRAHGTYKQKLLAAGTDSTALTVCFEDGWPHSPHRVLRNETLNRWEAAGCPPPGKRPGDGDVIGFSSKGEPILRYEDVGPREGMTGDIEEMALYAGTGVDRIGSLPSAGDLVNQLWHEVVARLQ